MHATEQYWQERIRQLQEDVKAAYDQGVADERADVEQRIAERIFNEEQVVNQTLWQDPTNPHLSGVLRGLQRARDLARGEDALLRADDCDRVLGCTCGTRTEIARGEDTP